MNDFKELKDTKHCYACKSKWVFKLNTRTKRAIKVCSNDKCHLYSELSEWEAVKENYNPNPNRKWCKDGRVEYGGHRNRKVK